MKKIALIGWIALTGTFAFTQNTNTPHKFIEVTGSAEMEIEPDEIHLIIGIQEYWKEEFEKKTEKEYKTKISIAEIENNLIGDLAKLGITRDKITVNEVGNYWRNRGKEFLVSKQFEITLSDFNKVNDILKTVDTKGINNMYLGELKHKNITEFRKQTKINALKAAKEKADYLLKSIGKQVGDVISIVEVEGAASIGRFYMSNELLSNNAYSADDSGIDQVKKITIRYEIKAQFEIR